MILVTGGTGFVGSHLVRRLVQEKIQTRCLVRKTSSLERLPRGIEVVYGDVNDKESLKKATEDVEAVIHLVGIILEHKGATFEIIHTQGTKNLVEASREAGVKRFIYVSALGSRENAQSRYHITKWQAEQDVIKSGMEYVILRPSIMIGERGTFITMLSNVIKKAPVVPIIGGDSKVQPIYVENTVDCLIKSLTERKTTNRIFEIAGPEQITYRQLFLTLMEALGVKKPTIDIPIWLMWLPAYILENVLDKPPITTQQLIMLQEDNICDIKEMQEVFNLKLVPLRDVLKKTPVAGIAEK
ncbi:putative nucleoside-diphosphate sugar epimerase [Candidatus Methanoperedens nitroreducens]|uniref:Putative nucleoside-diphosphate sugar epimerase n=1 Tax=Candidatus Methanoperedens nitratireducens TaxID=1392998 RepID=A0A062V4H5_9EURY|nr:complex I NDUFA9 subunit family protein [Candidatus Methanoperedens nitroreducens]KCZ72252.1 putative nucleoside-diphosphate sugar epimerase [Candidatus Methanoperedens nitroreducens]MDJ1421771.1 complex I NDUFA9 subunit family protein [Candidatus Methanoperedens sp.]